jgi:hypothetical protein
MRPDDVHRRRKLRFTAAVLFLCVGIFALGGYRTAQAWFAVAVFIAIIGYFVWQGRREIRDNREEARKQMGLCPKCGYDLRASPERCPECGAAVPAVDAR